jgi:hypothetical protein
MKKAEDIIFYNIESDTDGCETFYRYEEVIKAIKLAQEDAIRTTVKECAESAKIKWNYYRKDENPKEFEEYRYSENVRVDSYGEAYAVDVQEVDKDSILVVADKLIKEL